MLAARTVTVGSRFNGPPGSGNGGYAAGLVASALGSNPAVVTLKAPPPLDRPLTVERSNGGVVARNGDVVVAEAREGAVDVEPPPPVAFGQAVAASERGPFADAVSHPYPTCFVCGPLRAEGDGLRIFAGPIGEVYAAAWTPPAALAGPDGRMSDELVWAALDCPSSGPVANDAQRPGFLPIVLGRLAVRVDAPVVAGRPHVVMAWKLGIHGRKRASAAALYSDDGALCAVARALWIELAAPIGPAA